MDKARGDDTPTQQAAAFTSDEDDHSPSLRELDQIPGVTMMWYKLGLQLGVRADDLEIIEKNYPRDADTCKIKMFAEWRRGDTNPTYEKLVTALSAVGKRKLAESVCSAQGISPSVLDAKDASKKQQGHDPTINAATTEETVVPSQDREEMESEVVTIAREQIGQLQNEYKQLLVMTQEAIKAESPTLIEFRTSITNQLPEHLRLELAEPEKLRPMYDAKSIGEIFGIFDLHIIWNYLNFGLLQHLVEIYGDDKLKQRMLKYTMSVKTFRKQTTLKVFWKASPATRKCPVIPTNIRESLKRITFKHGQLDTTTTLEDIESYRQDLAQEYAFPDFIIILADIEKGCIATTWLVPPSLAAKLADEIKRGNVSFLEQHNILELKIQDSTVYHSVAAQTTDGAISGHSQTEGSVPEISFTDLEFGEQLGEGAVGVVYRGHWKSRDMDVAIKRVPGKINKTEIEILNKLRHSYIIQFHGVVVDRPGSPEHYIITELGEGGSLYDLLHKKKYQPSREESLRWAVQIAQGMKYLHQEKMMHRDLKSSNVLLTDEGNMKICDFGSAKHFDHTTKQTLTGTFRWMAPEVIKGEPVSLSSDVFSYGTLLYEILTGELPFADANTDAMVTSKIMNEEVPPIPASVESYLAKTLKQCWNANPKDRPTFYNILEILANREFDVAPPSRQALAQASPLLPLRVGHKRVGIADPAVHESTTKKASTLQGGAITLKEVEKPYQHIVKSETETTEHMKSTAFTSDEDGHSPSIRELDQIPGVGTIWYRLGLQLGVSTDKLDEIEKDYPQETTMRKIKMFAEWQRGDTNPTYEKLVRALAAVGIRKLAESVCSAQGISPSVLDAKNASKIQQGHGGAITLKEVEKPYQHIVKSETETTEHMKSTGGAVTLKEVEKPYQHIVKSETETTEHVKSTDYLRGVEVFAETQFIVKGKHSQTFKWEGHGLKLSIPEGAVLSKSVINIKAGLAGQFELPSDAQLVSPMYWLYCDYSFQNPVTLELQHCASIKNQSEYSSLSFIVAKCSQELPYKFKFLQKGTFSQHSSHGSINVKQFSIFGLVKKLFESSLFGLASRSYFAQLFYIDDGENAWKLDFIITWNLELCLTYIQQKYSTLAVEGPHTELQFERESISLVIPENGIITENDWAITPLNRQVITKEQVDKFKPGQRIPSCQLQVRLLTTDNPEILSYKLALEGAKEPFNFLTVTRTPVYGTAHGKKRPQQSEGDQIDEYDTVPRRKRPRHLEGSQSDVQVTTSPVEPTTSAMITEIPLQPIFDERPEIRELQLIKWCKGDEEKHLKIKASIAPRWKNLGITFGISLAELQAFERQNMLNQEDCCSSVFHTWLQNGSQPRDAYAVTWRGLIKALRDISFREIANELETALHSMT